MVRPSHPRARQCKRLAWQAIWQRNDIRVTVTAREEWTVEYDLGGTIWGGSRFAIVKGPVVLQWTALPASAASRILMRSRKGDRQNRRLKC